MIVGDDYLTAMLPTSGYRYFQLRRTYAEGHHSTGRCVSAAHGSQDEARFLIPILEIGHCRCMQIKNQDSA